MNTRSAGTSRAVRLLVARMGRLVRRAAPVALTVALLSSSVVSTRAQTNTDGAIYGKVVGNTKGAVAVESTATGLRRTTTPAADGSYRVGALPPGLYKVVFTPATGAPFEQMAEVRVNSATAVDLGDSTVRMEKFVVAAASSARSILGRRNRPRSSRPTSSRSCPSAATPPPSHSLRPAPRRATRRSVSCRSPARRSRRTLTT
jgi:hypothetical protein